MLTHRQLDMGHARAPLALTGGVQSKAGQMVVKQAIISTPNGDFGEAGLTEQTVEKRYFISIQI